WGSPGDHHQEGSQRRDRHRGWGLGRNRAGRYPGEVDHSGALLESRNFAVEADRLAEDGADRVQAHAVAPAVSGEGAASSAGGSLASSSPPGLLSAGSEAR